MGKSAKRRHQALQRKFRTDWERMIDTFLQEITDDSEQWRKRGKGNGLIFNRVDEALTTLKSEMAGKSYLTETAKRDMEKYTYKILEDHCCRRVSGVIAEATRCNLYPFSLLGRLPATLTGEAR